MSRPENKPVYLAIVSDSKRNSFPLVAWSMTGILAEVRKQCQFARMSDVTELQSNVEHYYGADILLGKIDGEWAQIGMLMYKERITD